MVYNAGYTTQVSTIDELRLGQSFAAVTPTTSGSSQVVSNSVVVVPAASTTTINFENFAASSAPRWPSR